MRADLVVFRTLLGHLRARVACRWRMPLMLAAALMAVAPVRAEGIVQVLERSQQMQLDGLRRMAVDESDPRARTIRTTFDDSSTLRAQFISRCCASSSQKAAA